jgi:DNA-binding SARP family transcriptional activator
MTLLELRLLGGFDCRSTAGEALPLPTRKTAALLAYLALTAGQAHPRDRLVGLFWGDRDQGQARADLRKSLSRLRQAVGTEARAGLVADAATVGVSPAAVDLDVARFERLVEDGTPETLERALALHRGELLAGLGELGEAFDEWLGEERRRLEELLRSALARLLDHYVRTGGIERAIQLALRLLALDPLQEGVHRTLIRLYLYQDRVGSALAQYERCRELLARELGISPSAETERLCAELRKLVPEGELPGAPRIETDSVPERATLIQAAAEERARRRAELARRPSIAVLPFAVPGDEALAHLGEGLSEEIAIELGRFRELDVVAPVTALAYGHEIAPERAAAEIGAAYLLAGTIRTLPDGHRIHARLIESATGRQIWAERLEGAQSALLYAGDELVRRIVVTLVGRIEEAQLLAAARRRPQDWQAHDLWLRGRQALRRPELAAVTEARRLFQEAVARDPAFARGYVGLAMTHLSEWACHSWSHWFFLREEALALARRAVELDDRDNQARCMLGLSLLYGREYDAAEREIARALELNPHDADVLAHAAAALALLGQHEAAVDAARTALRLAPYHPEWYAAFAGMALFTARLHEEAIATMAPAPEALCSTPAFLAACHAHLGRPEAGAPYRDTVHRHYRRQLARGWFAGSPSCVEWLLAMDPFRRAEDLRHYAEGLRKAGFA